MARDNARAEHDRIVSYWTHDRIANAVPRDFVKSGANDLASPKGNAKPTTGGGIKGASWTGDGPVVDRTGKVLFSMGGGNWICSGTVVNDTRADTSMVLTAGHCAIDEKTGIFATNWMFIPAFDTAPTYTCANSAYGCWTATALVVRKEFATAGAFNTQAITNDWAFAIVGPGGTAEAQLDTTTGSYPIAFDVTSKGDTLDAFGYPAAGKYHGSDLVYCEGAIGTDPNMGNATWGMPCDMTGGSSGGPWLKGFTATGGGTLSSLNSYGYSGSSVMYGPMFNSKTEATYGAALSATGNTTVSGG
jgi:V8-like Glu-specific endopeptidase